MRLVNKVAIITGAASGIGRASAYLFAKEGATLVVDDINDAGGEETVATIKADGGEAIFVHADVSIASEVEHLVKVTKDRFGKIDILFNNAGILRRCPVESTEESLWDHVYAVNVKGIFLGVKYVVPEMRKAGGGVIVNTASMAGVRPLRTYTAAYASSKGAVIALTKLLALELAPDKIRVNCICPARTETPMTEGDSEEWKRTRASSIPLGRTCKPEDIAYAALYLASGESSMLTGTSLWVDGGSGI